MTYGVNVNMQWSKMNHIRASVTVALFTYGHKLVMQLRDSRPGIEYPGYWSLISGWIEQGESPITAIRREIQEELSDSSGAPIRYGKLYYLWCCNRMDRPWCEYYFNAKVETPSDDIVIHEGQRVGVMSLDKAVKLDKIAPHHKNFLIRLLYGRNKSK